MSRIEPLEFYTKEIQPLQTKVGVRFHFKYKNTSKENIDAFDALIIMGDATRKVTLPGAKPQESRTVDMVLTNDMSDEICAVGVRVGSENPLEVIEKFSYMGSADIKIGELDRFSKNDTAQKVFYQVYIHNKGTRHAKQVQVRIEKDNIFYGELQIPKIAPKTSVPVNVGINKSLEGLIKINVSANVLMKNHLKANRSFHLSL